MAKIKVQDTEITIITNEDQDFISLTDMAGAKGNESRAADVIKNWLRNRYTIEFLGVWEIIHNPDFKVVEFDQFGKLERRVHQRRPHPKRSLGEVELDRHSANEGAREL